ncbi:uncharacterized protein K444DRAFT_385860 [Hyaloscypha bicolor E]|uniref:Uncharacterized protein n=1 Tax=Hyaloscypha bicolor E TaxID=1095630 RepID=A0A2J6TDE8_9HELO|nr:uncharacterized protein K444DRAFT_385860 [Hyaloscypha bicolor E]PMD61054.1 hypothetical protein K444DRAFT_385860 [Hyaloscypha bicolor E]
MPHLPPVLFSFINSCFSCAYHSHGRILTWPPKAQQPSCQLKLKAKLKQIPMTLGVTLPHCLLVSRSFDTRIEGDIMATRMDCTVHDCLSTSILSTRKLSQPNNDI